MGVGASITGTILQAGGAFTQASGQRSALDYESSVAKTNAKVAQWQASQALNNGQIAEENQGLKTAALMGSQRVALASGGVDLGSGNANDILTTTKFMGNRDALQIHDNAMLQAWGYKTQSQYYSDNAQHLSNMADGINPWLSGGTSLLTGATNVASNWEKLSKVTGGSFASTVGNWFSKGK